ncbi:MAG: thioredoxin family protein [Rhodospirillaceae bacterium]
MAEKRKVEVFSAGCPACEDAIALVRRIVCSSCEVTIMDMKNIEVAKRAKGLGIRRVPAVVINGEVAECCSGGGVDEAVLKLAGIGKQI